MQRLEFERSSEYETGKESSERFPLDDAYFFFSDIYPLSGTIFEGLAELYEVDYHVSMCNDRDTWYWCYYQDCSRILWEKEEETE